MSHAFRLAIAFTMRQEDARPDALVTAVDVGDGEGLTKFGVGQRSNPDVDVAALTVDQAIALLRAKYWVPLQADPLPLPLAVGLFDAAVNHGPRSAVKLLQAELGVAVDGVIGPVTVAAAQRNPWRTLRGFYALRGCRYATLATFPTYGKVWMERLCESYAYCLGLPD
jgi:lysozyme family protein